jgi:hypothetical protein
MEVSSPMHLFADPKQRVGVTAAVTVMAAIFAIALLYGPNGFARPEPSLEVAEPPPVQADPFAQAEEVDEEDASVAFRSPAAGAPLPSGAGALPSAALVQAVEAAAAGVKPLGVFAAPDLAESFFAQWEGRLPEQGQVTVALADQVDAGAENGHTVPVTVWVAGVHVVTGLKGEAAFVPAGEGWQIRHLALDPIDLKVRSWEDAVRRLRAMRPAFAVAKRVEAPFYGRFHLDTGRGRYGVDAETGDVVDE